MSTARRPMHRPAWGAALLLGAVVLSLPAPAEDASRLAVLADELRARLTEGAAVPLRSPEAVTRFYAAREFRPAWAGVEGLRPEARDLAAAAAGAATHGLRPEDYHAAALGRPWDPAAGPAAGAELDLLLTDAFLTYADHLSGGRVLPQQVEADWEPLPRERDPAAALELALGTGRVGEALEALAPGDPGYRALRSALARYRAIEARGGWEAVPNPPVLHPGDESPAASALRARLAAEGYLAAAEGPAVVDASLAEAVRGFQTAHGLETDGVVGRATWGALQVPAGERIAQIEANLERWRWRREDLGPRHLRVNVPAFRLDAVESGKTVLSLAVVVGRAEDPTPSFSGQVTHVVVNPSWSVPPRIARNELLPEVRRDPGLLARRGFRVLSGWGGEAREIDPAAVDWDSASLGRDRLRFSQSPGPGNALGQLKFLVPNRFHVYLHDTPARTLFARAQRAFSHGCIRVDRPQELAEYLLRGDRRWDSAAVQEAIAEGEERAIPLPAPVPVHLEYFTAWAEEGGPAHFRADIYGRDGRLGAALDAGPPST